MRLIDADALLKNYIGGNILTARTDYAQGARDIIEDIIDAPTIEPERKRGKWETDEWGDWHCSICKAIIEKDEQSRHYYKYCYHCGAEMEGEECQPKDDPSHPFADDVLMGGD